MINDWYDFLTPIRKNSHELFIRVKGLAEFEIDICLQTFDDI